MPQRPGRRPTSRRPLRRSSRSKPADPSIRPGETDQRLQKALASAGLASRRAIEAWIGAGRVTVDGVVATLGQKVSGRERILVDGRPVAILRRLRAPPKVLIYHKPAGEICSRRDPEGRPTVFNSLPRLEAGRWVGVGRLDVATSGLLLLTTDGALANALMRPSRGIPREYAVRIQGAVADAVLDRLRMGIELDDGPARCASVDPAGGEGSNQWFRMVVSEGRNRLVRRLWEAAGCRVSRLIRVRYGPIGLPRNLRAGRHRLLDSDELSAVYAAAGLPDPGGPAAARKHSKQHKQSSESKRTH